METEAMTQDDFMKAALKHQAALVAYAYARLRDYHLADDVVQESLVVMMRKWTDFQPGTSLHAFARQIVYYKTLEAIRARQRQEVTLADEQLEAAVSRTLDERLTEDSVEQQNARVYALQDCLSQLSQRAVAIVSSFYRDSKSYQELSAMYSQSQDAIKKALYRYRKTLQECTERRLHQTEVAG